MSYLTEPAGFRLKGRHVLACLLAFFGTVMAVNAVMVTIALDSWTGLTTRTAYNDGLAYNETIADVARQSALGWRVGTTVERLGAPAADGSAMVWIAARPEDGAGDPLTGARVTIQFRHPILEANDLDVTLVESTAGLYEAMATLPTVGFWKLTVRVVDPMGQTYRSDREARIE
jgi:nitrogen fixation protein FixH